MNPPLHDWEELRLNLVLRFSVTVQICLFVQCVLSWPSCVSGVTGLIGPHAAIFHPYNER